MKNLNKMMKQAQQMQERILKLQEEMGDHREEATAGGGVVKAEANGRGELVALSIDPEVASDDVDMLQDLVLAAANEALRKAREAVEEEMKKATGGMGLPGMM